MRAAQFAEQYSGEDLRISVDLVVFSDHTYIGPDVAGTVPGTNRENRISIDLATKLKNMPLKDGIAYVDAIVKGPAGEFGSDPNVRQAVASQIAKAVIATAPP
jgi:hypothetical protein